MAQVAEQLHEALHEGAPPSRFLAVLESAVVRAVSPGTDREKELVGKAVRATACILALERLLSDAPIPDWPPFVAPDCGGPKPA